MDNNRTNYDHRKIINVSELKKNHHDQEPKSQEIIMNINDWNTRKPSQLKDRNVKDHCD